MLQLVPVVEVLGFNSQPGWLPDMDERRWIELGPETALEDVARIVAVIVAYGQVLPETAREAAQLIADGACKAAPGGLVARADGSEVVPGCCCGLEGWRDWYRVKPGGQSPWLGHDPSPYIECRAEAAVLWPDEPDTPRKAPLQPLVATYPEFDAALARASERFTGFLDRLEEWAVFGEAWAPGLLEGFAVSFDISRRG